MSGLFCFTLINRQYIFTLLGSILFSIGQPFIINCPAKIATYWFFDKNVNTYLLLETFCYRTYDWLNANRHRLWLYTTNINSILKFFTWWSKRWDILPIHGLIFTLNNRIYLSIYLHEKITSNCTINRRIAIENGHKIIV
jgi:hypothetical protein